ncbi:MAG: RagB/SusD family nutrient uptake outer membrane protein [Pedobacter sp.]|jgi:hypothetical protein
MKTLRINLYQKIIRWLLLPSIAFCLYSCSEDLLTETPKSSLNADIVLKTKQGFENYLIGLIYELSLEVNGDFTWHAVNIVGTDLGDDSGTEYSTYANWVSYLTPINSEVVFEWNWAYSNVIPQANTIIVYANKPEAANIWATATERNAVIAEARFCRGYTYNILANLYGGVPIVDTIIAEPKFDYTRATRQEVLEFVKADLEFASRWLPTSVVKAKEGRIVKAAADHLLSEVCISLGEYDNAITAASNVINSGLYQLMTERFGSQKTKAGDVFSDLFRTNNYNRSSGNLESIWVYQVESYTDGGGNNSWLHNWGPFLVHVKSPDGYLNVVTNSMGRGVGRVRPSWYLSNTIWKDDWNDMRTSPFNWRRVFYYNNPASAFFGQVIEPKTTYEDTSRSIYPYTRKIEGMPRNGNITSGQTDNDLYVYRLAETYLLRAEAYLRNNDPDNAALDINVVRARANATPVDPADVTIDYILDERARELVAEEPRRRTLIRMGKLVERVRAYGFRPNGRTSIQDYHNWWPIPQTAIDANFGAVLKQNPGY